jgi:tRNA dimethylallyltransferase
LEPEAPVLVVVLGPTAVGKSRVAVDLALRFGGEIVSADSIQVYRGFDIGTDKPGPEERRGVPHHLIDIVGPEVQYTAADFVRDALAVARSPGGAAGPSSPAARGFISRP